MEIKIKMNSYIFEQLNETQRERKKESVSFFSRKRHTIKLVDYYPLSGAKVATFNE